MEADWEVEIGGGAPVIDACWNGFVDLRFDPRTRLDTLLKRAQGLPESKNLPELAEALVRLNGLRSPVWTSKCDVWPVLDANAFDAGELDAPWDEATHAWACYIDLVPRNESGPSPAAEKPGSWTAETPGSSATEDSSSWAAEDSSSRASGTPGSWVGQGFIPGVKATESTRPLKVAKKNLGRGFVTGHDFSRADASDLKGWGFSPAGRAISEDGALAPEGVSTEDPAQILVASASRLTDAALHWCKQLRSVPLTHCRADLIVRHAIIAPDQLDHGITAYLTACGQSAASANAVLGSVVAAFANTLCPDSTVE